ncbi:MAG: hypothetical protein GX614_11440 [Sandaracinaceae bacterium]|nr:hypothetical protein [Sandaracinaceae bacterium]
MMKKILLFSLFIGLVGCADGPRQNDATSGDEGAPSTAESLRSETEMDDGSGRETSEREHQEVEAVEEAAEAAPDEGARAGSGLSHDRSGCAPAGCSGQICAEAGAEIMTTCEFRPEYACYQKATCERQPSGACGWTETDELRECLREAGSNRSVLQ